MLYFYKRAENDTQYPYVLRSTPPEEGVSAIWTSEGCGEFPKEVIRFIEEHYDVIFKSLIGRGMRGWTVLTEEQFHSILNFAQALDIECLMENDLPNEWRDIK